MSIEINPLSDVLGAEVTGIDIAQPIDGDTAAPRLRLLSYGRRLPTRGARTL